MVKPSGGSCNVLKKFPLQCWKKVGNSAKIFYRKDNDIDCQILELSSMTTGANSIILPSSNDKRLKLTGRYVYFLLRPVEDKGFLLHLDAHAADGLDVRITVSNVFKELKLTNLSLHLPFKLHGQSRSSEAIDGIDWTLLKLDLDSLIHVFQGKKFQWISRLQLCSNLLIIGILTSDTDYSLSIGQTALGENRKRLRFPLFRETAFESTNSKAPVKPFLELNYPECLNIDSKENACATVTSVFDPGITIMDSQRNINHKHTVPQTLPFHGVISGEIMEEKTSHKQATYSRNSTQVASDNQTKPSIMVAFEKEENRPNDEHLDAVQSDQRKRNMENPNTYRSTELESIDIVPTPKCPNLDCSHILACPTYCSQLLMTPDGSAVVFSCETIVIVMSMETRVQHKLCGHTNEVTALCIASDGQFLASGCTTGTHLADSVNMATVHVWRLPNFGSVRHLHPFIGTGRAIGMNNVNGLSLSENSQCLCGIGEDEYGRGAVLVWDVRMIDRDSVLPLIARATTEPNLVRIHPIPSENPALNQSTGLVLRFVTVYAKQGSIRSTPVSLGHKRNNTQSGFRLWRLKYTEAENDPVGSQTKTHLSSAPVNLTSILPVNDCHGLNFVDCYLIPFVPERKSDKVRMESEMENMNTSCLLIICSTSGHIVEFNPDLFAVTRVYRIFKTERDSCSSKPLIRTCILYERLSQANVSITCMKKQADGEVALIFTNVHYIHLGPGTMDGWLATGSEDGYFRLWNFRDLTKLPLILEVAYAGPISAIGAATMKPTPVKPSPGASELRWLSRACVVLATRTGGLACLTLTGEPGDNAGFASGPMIMDCQPSKLLAWQVNSPVISSDIAQFGTNKTTSVVMTATQTGLIRVWKMTSVNALRSSQEVIQEECDSTAPIVLPTMDTPLFDLSSPDEVLSHVVLRPMTNASTPDPELDLQIACGYRDSGIIRIFSPSKQKLVQEITHHQGYSISALRYSYSGTLLYSSDASGKLAVWCIQTGKENTMGAELFRSIPGQIAVFTIASDCTMHPPSKAHSILSCCPDDDRIAFIGPSATQLTIARGSTLQTLVQVDLDQLNRQCFPHKPDPLFGICSLASRFGACLLDFGARCPQSGSRNVMLATPTGHVFRLHGRDGRLLAYATSSERELVSEPDRLNPTGDRRSERLLHPQWSALAVSPDGRFMVLADAVRPLLYTASVRLHRYKSQHSISGQNDTSFHLQCKTFSGHLYPVTSILFTQDQKCCLTVDNGGKFNVGSAIFVWQFSHPYRECRSALKFSTNEHASSVVDQDSTQAVTIQSSCLKSPRSLTESNQLTLKTPPPSVTDEKSPEQNEPIVEERVSRTQHYLGSPTPKNQLVIPQSYRHPKWKIPETSAMDSRLTEVIDQAEALLNFSKFEGCNGASVQSVIGYVTNGLSVDSLVWDAESGFFIFTAGAFLICETLKTGCQHVFTSRTENSNGWTECAPHPRLCSELLTTVVLSSNRRYVTVGSLTTWEIPLANESTNGNHVLTKNYRESRSSIIVLSLKTSYATYPTFQTQIETEELRIAEQDPAKRVPYSKIMLEQNALPSQHSQNPLLLNMAFAQNSRYLITIGEFRATLVGLWCTRKWTLIQQYLVRGTINRVACSLQTPEQFVTAGISPDFDSHTDSTIGNFAEGSLIFWKIAEHFRARDGMLVPQSNAKNCHAGQECSSALYIRLGESIHSYNTMTYSTGTSSRELLIVSEISGLLSMWDPKLRVCLFTWKPATVEHGLLTQCGPAGLLTGDASGCLRVWHLSVSMHQVEGLTCENSRPRHYLNATEFTDLVSNITVQLAQEIHAIHRNHRSAICVGHFDTEGKLGVVGTDDSNLWYIDWSNVESSQKTSYCDSSDDIASGAVRLFAGHPDEIRSMAWWDPRPSISTDANNILDECASLLLTASADGTVRAWDVESRELLCKLKVEDYNNMAYVDRYAVTCMSTLEESPIRCKGMETNGIIDENDKQSEQFLATGCVALAYADTRVQLLCLHRLRLIAQTAPLSPVTNDCATALQFIGPDHLVLGTRSGLLIVLGVHPSGNISVVRVLRDHLKQTINVDGITGLERYPWPVPKIRFDSTDRTIDKRLELLQSGKRCNEKAEKSELWHMQTNPSIGSDGLHNETTVNWIWLSVGSDARLGLWLLQTRYPLDWDPKPTHSSPNSVRCQLLSWIPLDALTWVEKQHPSVSNSDAFQSSVWRYRAQFVTYANGSHSLNVGYGLKEEIQIVICQSTPERTSKFWLHTTELTGKEIRQPVPWFELPQLIHAFHFNPTGPEHLSFPARMLAIGQKNTEYELISALVYFGSSRSVQVQCMTTHRLKHTMAEIQQSTRPLLVHKSCSSGKGVHIKFMVTIAIQSILVVAKEE